MEYQIKVFDSRCSQQLTTFSSVFTKGSGGDALVVESWSRRINSWGTMIFSINQFSQKATERNLCVYNRVQLCRRGKDKKFHPIWSGYIERLRTYSDGEVGTRIDIACVGMEKILTKRIANFEDALACGPVVAVGSGADDAERFLNEMNAEDPTCITIGDMITNVSTDLLFKNQSMFDVFTTIARASDSEFHVYPDFSMDFVPTLGINQQNVVQLTFNRDGSYGSNVRNVDRSQTGDDMVNCVTAINPNIVFPANFCISACNDDKKAKFGLLEKVITVTESISPATIQQIAQSYVNQYSCPDIGITMIPEQARMTCPSGDCIGVEYGQIDLGDIVTTKIATEYGTEVKAQRVAEINASVDENGLESVGYSMSDVGAFITSSFVREDDIEELRRELSALRSSL